jgi:hypothetical protein
MSNVVANAGEEAFGVILEKGEHKAHYCWWKVRGMGKGASGGMADHVKTWNCLRACSWSSTAKTMKQLH